jgi:hypothetical protein
MDLIIVTVSRSINFGRLTLLLSSPYFIVRTIMFFHRKMLHIRRKITFNEKDSQLVSFAFARKRLPNNFDLLFSYVIYILLQSCLLIHTMSIIIGVF